MKAVTPNQVAEAVARIAHVDWSLIGRGELQRFIDLPPKEAGERLEAFLKNGGHITVVERIMTASEVSGLFNPSEYFISRDGLNVTREFTARILSLYNGPVKKRGLEGVAHVDLLKNIHDSVIIGEHLGGMDEVRKHAFTPDQIADQIDKQKDGGDGELLVNGFANIFYVIGEDGELFSVHVTCRSGHDHWQVHAKKLDEDRGWHGGRRVFLNKN